MAATPTYLVAKYVPDPVRMEPRNIGVVLWSRGGAACRFMESSEAAFVEDKKMYQRWTKFWGSACTDGEVHSPTRGTVASDKREFLDAMIDTQRGNYLLYEGGQLLEKIKAADRKAATDYLYRELVGDFDGKTPQDGDGSLKDRSDALFEESGLAEREEFIDGYELELEAAGVTQPFKFDHAWAPGKLAALFQRVHLSIQQSTTNAAFLFAHAKGAKAAQSAERYAIVSGDEAAGSAVAGRRKLLEGLCDVIDLTDLAAAKQRLRRFVH